MDTASPIDPDAAWAAVKRRDRSFDRRFVTGVLTTGIYCRPSCAARHQTAQCALLHLWRSPQETARLQALPAG
jgi:methylphosphotriester-DNA--protein-cysteine methyltransferase